VLPNGRIYGSERLKVFNKKIGTEEGWVRDPVAGLTGEKWHMGEVRKVYVM
jgi:macrophage erythroblast attacher